MDIITIDNLRRLPPEWFAGHAGTRKECEEWMRKNHPDEIGIWLPIGRQGYGNIYVKPVGERAEWARKGQVVE